MSDGVPGVRVPHDFNRIEILCPDDRHHRHTQGALEIRSFGGVARRPDVIDTLSALQLRFMDEPGIRAVNIRRHAECGFQLRNGETVEGVAEQMRRLFDRAPNDLHMFVDPAEDVLCDLEVLRQLGWLPGTRFAGYVMDLDTKQSTLVGEFTVPGL